jgi:hypothetical protein
MQSFPYMVWQVVWTANGWLQWQKYSQLWNNAHVPASPFCVVVGAVESLIALRHLMCTRTTCHKMGLYFHRSEVFDIEKTKNSPKKFVVST